MNEAEFLAEAYRQASATSAVLGGLAFTAAAAILAVGAGTTDSRALTRMASVTAGAAVASAACLVVASLAWSLLTVEAVRAINLGQAMALDMIGLSRPASIAFILGIVWLFVAVGASGWIGSRILGLVTSFIAGLAGIAAMLFVFQFVM